MWSLCLLAFFWGTILSDVSKQIFLFAIRFAVILGLAVGPARAYADTGLKHCPITFKAAGQKNDSAPCCQGAKCSMDFHCMGWAIWSDDYRGELASGFEPAKWRVSNDRISTRSLPPITAPPRLLS